MENWKNIPGYEGFYMVSDSGYVKSVERIVDGKNGGKRKIKGRVLSYLFNSCGYVRVALTKEGNLKFKILSRIVAAVFVPNPDRLPEVNHKDGNKLNNASSNLEWSSVADNRRHAWRIGLNRGNTGKKLKRA